ncbi:MAG TPA: PEP-CTERM sorting domain-containing protein [Gemmataceae bacterium]|jgi:hypothetical protein
MRSKSLSFVLGAAAFALVASDVRAQPVNVLSPSDFVIGIDNNRNRVGNTNTGAEGPTSAFDGNPAGDTKWFSAAREFGGLIITPAGGPATVQSLQFTTANDSPNRDPVTFQLFGTNNPVTTVNNGSGREDVWTFLGSGNTGFATSNLAATVRNTAVAPVDVTNGTAFSSYKIVFPALRLGDTNANTPSNPNGLQINEVRMFNAPAGGGTNVALNPTVAIAIDQHDSASPPAEGPRNAIDGAAGTKYLNFGREGTGLIITPAAGATTVGGLQITTANDAPGRDPASFELYGTNGPITSVENSDGTAEALWTLIASGGLNLPGDPAIGTDQRGVDGPVVTFANSTAYTSYKIIFPDNKSDVANADSIQFGELRLFAAVPEPSSLALVGVAALGLLRRRRRRA